MYIYVDLGPDVEPADIDASGNVLVHRGAGLTPALIRVSGEVVDISAKVGVPIHRSLGMNDLGQVVAEGAQGYVCHLEAGIAQPIAIDLPIAINNGGTVVGRVDGRPAFVALAGSDPIYIFADESPGSALDINESGTVVGVGFVGGSFADQVAWSFRPGQGLEAHTAGTPSVATAINEDGTIVGVDDGAGFVVDPSGGKTTVLPVGASVTSLLDIDDTGRYVGLLASSSGQRRGIVGHGAMVTELGPLVVGGNVVTVDIAVAINNAGWIAAVGYVGAERRGLLLKPVVAPGRFAALATVLHILHGGRLDDAGHGIRVPGGPEPIPPGPGPWFAELSASRRDALIGMAVAELSELFGDRGTRTGVRALALDRVRADLEDTLAAVGVTASDRMGGPELGPGFPPLGELVPNRRSR